MEDGSLFVWGKNDRGQMGVGAGVGIDMIESENSPVQVNLVNANNEAQIIKDFTNGQNTMLIQDENNQIYKTGLKLDYSPRPLNFDSDFTVDNVTALACGRKHYVILNDDNKLLVWGNVFKEKP